MAEVAPEVATAYPTISIADLTAEIRLTNELEIVHLTGQLQREAGGQFLSLTDGTGKILVARNGLGENLAGAEVEAIGNCRRVGTNLVLCGSCIRERSSNDEVAASLPTLTTAEQIMRLKSDEARRGYPVLLRGVVTCTWPGSSHNLILQDATRGIFLAQPPPGVSGLPRIGEFWEAEGVTYAGYFAPMVMANRMTRLGEGRLPVPLQPTWDQLLNGSLDSQFVQIEGLIIDLNLASSQVTLLTHWGKIAVTFDCETPPELGQFQNKLVRIRGCLLPVWDATTHLLKVGEIRLGSATINADQTLPSDPFTAPMKSIGELLRYDIQASMFQRVRISGQFVAERAGEYFLASGGNGARFVPKNPAEFHPGDLVEVAGIPELGGPSPVLREAAVRKTGVAPLPPPKKILANNLLLAENDATRVQLEAVLLNTRQVRDDQILDLQNGSQIFSARLRDGTRALASIEPGTRVALTGIYAGQHGAQVVGKSVDSFELLLDSARDVRVLARPPWWTLKRLVLAMTMLAGGLGMAGVWIVLLRRQVERRTAQLERATRQREQAERNGPWTGTAPHCARFARRPGQQPDRDHHARRHEPGRNRKIRAGDNVSQIVKKARDSVNALDVIVWAVNPRENTLQSLADYLASYADEFLTASGITCRLNLPVSFPGGDAGRPHAARLVSGDQGSLEQRRAPRRCHGSGIEPRTGIGPSLDRRERQWQRLRAGYQRLGARFGQHAGTTRQTGRKMPH